MSTHSLFSCRLRVQKLNYATALRLFTGNRVLYINNNRLVIMCGDGNCVEILEIQAEGKKAMSAADFMRGNAVNIGDKFE